MTARWRLLIAGALAPLLGVLAGAPAGAVSLKLIKGDQAGVCRDVSKNLAAFPDVDPTVAAFPIDPGLADFRKVDWETLDPLHHVAVLREIVMRQMDQFQRQTEAQREAHWQAARNDILDRAGAGDIGLGRTRIDINNDGRVETVYRYGYRKWPTAAPDPARTLAWVYHVLAGDDAIVSQQMWRYGNNAADAFIYRGRTYIASRSPMRLAILEPAVVPQGAALAMRHVCVYRTDAGAGG